VRNWYEFSSLPSGHTGSQLQSSTYPQVFLRRLWYQVHKPCCSAYEALHKTRSQCKDFAIPQIIRLIAIVIHSIRIRRKCYSAHVGLYFTITNARNPSSISARILDVYITQWCHQWCLLSRYVINRILFQQNSFFFLNYTYYIYRTSALRRH
jgi:hypothetical protein